MFYVNLIQLKPGYGFKLVLFVQQNTTLRTTSVKYLHGQMKVSVRYVLMLFDTVWITVGINCNRCESKLTTSVSSTVKEQAINKQM